MEPPRGRNAAALPGPYRERTDRRVDAPRPAAPYAAAPDGILTAEGLHEACRHVWRDSNSVVMLGADILTSEPVSYDDKNALLALKRHIARAGRRSFIEDVLPKLGFQPPGPETGRAVCTRCGNEAAPLHLGCTLCEDCCDCRPADAT